MRLCETATLRAGHQKQFNFFNARFSGCKGEKKVCINVCICIFTHIVAHVDNDSVAAVSLHVQGLEMLFSQL